MDLKTVESIVERYNKRHNRVKAKVKLAEKNMGFLFMFSDSEKQTCVNVLVSFAELNRASVREEEVIFQALHMGTEALIKG